MQPSIQLEQKLRAWSAGLGSVGRICLLGLSPLVLQIFVRRLTTWLNHLLEQQSCCVPFSAKNALLSDLCSWVPSG